MLEEAFKVLRSGYAEPSFPFAGVDAAVRAHHAGTEVGAGRAMGFAGGHRSLPAAVPSPHRRN
jgi:hypothetical protein